MTKYQQMDWQHFTLVILCDKFWLFRLFQSSEHIPLIEMENLCALHHKALTDTHTHLYTNNIKSVHFFIPCIIVPYNEHEPRDTLDLSKKEKINNLVSTVFFLAFYSSDKSPIPAHFSELLKLFQLYPVVRLYFMDS